MLIGTYTRYPVAAVLAALGVILAALYILLAYQRTMQGPLRLPLDVSGRAMQGLRDLRLREVLAIAPLLALMIFLGIYPKPLTDVINPAVEATMVDAGFTDPAPTVPTAATPAGESE